MTKPRIIIATNCRAHWLDIFHYEDVLGNCYACPPSDRGWFLKVEPGKRDEYERRRKTREFSVPEHTGRSGKMIDNSRTA